MIELKSDRLVFRFPEVHEKAILSIEIQRTLRVPDDDQEYPLPPGLGNFSLRHVDDHAERVPAKWLEHGGVMLPMYQSEAAWINFESGSTLTSVSYPFAVKIAAGKINAVTGEAWSNGLQQDPQDYMSVPTQPWLDGFCVEKGIIRQFVAMPLGSGYSAEEQITEEDVHGGLQIVVYPLKAEAYEREMEELRNRPMVLFQTALCEPRAGSDMGLAPGGRMRQEIFDDPKNFEDWDTRHASRCFVHIANSMVWRDMTGANPPTVSPTAAEYNKAGLPWFEYYSDGEAVPGSEDLKKLKSVAQLAVEKNDVSLPENASVKPQNVVTLRKGLERNQVREGQF